MSAPSNLVDLLCKQAEERGERRIYTFLADGETEGRVLTYRALDRESRAIAVAMLRHVKPGDRVLLLYEPGLDFISAFLACQYAGVVAVPVYPPRKIQEWPRFAAIATDCGATAMCTQTPLKDPLEAGIAATPALSGVVVIPTDAVDVRLSEGWRRPVIGNDDLAFLQYTSGSTGVPKGVMVSQANLLHNEALITKGFGVPLDSMSVSWLPQYHDMGLIGAILQPLYRGGQCVLMSPFSFLQHPVRWLKAISKYRAEFTGGPNFAYELCVGRVTEEDLATLDLSSWRVAFNGAEPVRLATLERFAARFAPRGFRPEAFFPCYGLAEGTLFVTGSSPTELPKTLHVDASELERNALVRTAPGAPGARAIVGCGTPPGQIVCIVDPHTLERCPDGRVGEIWVSGPSIARGYWNRPEATHETFEARISGTNEGPFLRTGDLGVSNEGELYVTGRLKELIIIDGRNHYPQDIEETIQSGRPALRRGCGAAFSVDVEGNERLVVVQELVTGVEVDLVRLSADVRAAIVDKHGIAVYRLVLVAHGAVLKTSSGKLRRRKVRELYLEGGLAIVHQSEGAVSKRAFKAAAPVHLPSSEVEVVPPSAPPSARLPGSGQMPSAPKLPTSARLRAASTKLPVAAPAAPPGSSLEAERLIASLIAARIGIPAGEIDVKLAFSAFGLDSRALVGLSGELETRLARKLPPQIFYSYPSIETLAQYLTGGLEAPRERRKKDRRKRAQREPIAIVGMACRLPGAKNLDAYWELLKTGRDAIVEVPSTRWDIDAWYDPDPAVAGKMATRWGGFIDEVECFDSDFFGISPREAEAMDPQQRLILELAWHALEDAGIMPDSLRGSRTGVFVGISGGDYARLQADTTGLLSGYAGIGNALSIVANRLSYVLDLRGPSLALDTACSSALTAVHEASTNLKSGECDVALVGGINLLLSPDVTVSFSQSRMMAPDGRCKTFSQEANGYVRAEGGGVIVLKRLSDAVAAGDHIWAVIPGSACNQDGRSNGITAPNGLAQRAVLRDALQQAGWQPSEVQYVETHGTGTQLGDPIEAEALGSAYGEGRSASAPLLLGAVKSQIGHLESAAGIAGIIKTALCLEHGTIVANLHCATPNPLILLEDWRLALPRAVQPWPAAEVRKAGVSAFGFGGTNVHVLLQQAPETTPPAKPKPAAKRPVHVLALSAKGEASLAGLSSAYAAATRAAGDAVGALCHAANTTRQHLREARRAVLGESAADLAAALQATRDEAPAAPRSRNVAMLFTGQGAQYVAMGRRLYETHPDFHAIVEACDRALAGKRSVRLLDLLFPSAEKSVAMDALLGKTEYTQPALYALEYALGKLWRSWGVEPTVVMGHSVGEFAAAAIAGVFDMEDGLRLIEARGRLMAELPEAGGMLAAFAHEREITDLLPAFADRLSIGAFNGPGQMVLSGALPELEKLRLLLEQRGIETKRLKVSHGFHSPLMMPMVDAFRRIAETVTYREPSIPVVSNVTGQVETARLASADYWVEHVFAPVRFSHGVEQMKKLDVGVLLEIGPRPVLVGMARRILSASDVLFLPSLDNGKDDWRMIGGALTALYEAGIDVDWNAFDAPFAFDRARPPVYPFERKAHWFDAKKLGRAATTGGAAREHPLLGHPLSSPRRKQGERHFEGVVQNPGPAFHRLPTEFAERRVSVLSYLEIAIAAQHALFPTAARHVRSIALEGLLQVPTKEECRIQTLCEPTADGFGMEVWAQRSPDSWQRVASAQLVAGSPAGSTLEPLEDLRARIGQAIDVDAWYETTRESGFDYCASPNRALRNLWWAPSEVLAEVTFRHEDDPDAEGIWLKHSVWHAANQVLGALCPRDGHGTYFPVRVEDIQFFGDTGRSLVIHAQLREHTTDPPRCLVDLSAYAEDGTPFTIARGIRLMPDESMQSPRAKWRKGAPEARVERLVETLRRVVARAFRRPAEEIPLTQPLTALGLDSLTAVDIVAKVEDLFEIGIPVTSLQQGVNLRELAMMLNDRLAEAEGPSGRSDAPQMSPLVQLNRGDPSIPSLFLMHPTGGSAFCYGELARHLGSQPVVGVQSPAFVGRAEEFVDLEGLADHCLKHIRERQPRGPYRLGGWSMGGVVAFQIAHQLEAEGEEIECLLLIDAPAPRETPMRPSQSAMLKLAAQSLGMDVSPLSDDDLEGEMHAALEVVLGLAQDQGHALRSLNVHELRRLLSEFEKNLPLLGAYTGRPYSGTATVLRAETPLSPGDPEASGHDWKMWLAGLDALHTLPGDHFSMLSGSHLTLTASYVRRALRSISGRHGASASADRPLSLVHPRSPQNVVITSTARVEGGVHAQLVVDESHPYFFDHPLDHVTGILLVEGVLQLVEAARITDGAFVRHLRMTFPRFCDKDRPVTLEVRHASEGERYSARAVQGGVPVMTMKLRTEHLSERTWPGTAPGKVSPGDAKLLHRARIENVLIGAWSVHGDVAECRLVEPPAGHQLAEGDPRNHSALYALDAVRQLVTGLAHSVYEVPLGMPMNLVGVELVLDAPIPRGVAVTLRHTLKPIPPAGASTFAHFETKLVVGDAVVGECTVTAQLLTKDAYLAARYRTP